MLGLKAEEAENIVALIASHGGGLILAFNAKTLASTLVLLRVEPLSLLRFDQRLEAGVVGELNVRLEHRAENGELAFGGLRGGEQRRGRRRPDLAVGGRSGRGRLVHGDRANEQFAQLLGSAFCSFGLCLSAHLLRVRLDPRRALVLPSICFPCTDTPVQRILDVITVFSPPHCFS